MGKIELIQSWEKHHQPPPTNRELIDLDVPTFQVSSSGRSEGELDVDGAGNGARTRDLNFGNSQTAVHKSATRSTGGAIPSWSVHRQPSRTRLPIPISKIQPIEPSTAETASTSSIAVSRSTQKVHRRINQAGQIPTVITRLPRVMSDIAAAAGAARIRVFICMMPLDATCVGGSKRSATQGLCTWSTLVACDRAEIRPPARIGAGPY